MRFKIDGEFLIPADSSGRAVMREHLLAKHPSLDVTTYARSILSREIEGFGIGEGGRYILIAAAHHALETISTNIAFLLIDLLCHGRKVGRINGNDCKLLLTKYRFIVLPCVNPDGVELRYHGADESPLKDRLVRMSGADFSRWQANARGVDLNHNYDAGFMEYKRMEAAMELTCGASLYSGEYPESEPEVRGVASLVRTLMPSAVVSLHTQGEEIFFSPRDRRCRHRAERIAAEIGYAVATPEGTAAYGGLCDYSGSLGIPSFTLELGKGHNPLSESDIPSIFARVGATLATLPTIL